MLDRPRLSLGKSKNTLKSNIIQWSCQTVRLTGKSDKKPNELHEIPYLECGLRFWFRPTVRPQLTKIGGAARWRRNCASHEKSHQQERNEPWPCTHKQPLLLLGNPIFQETRSNLTRFEPWHCPLNRPLLLPIFQKQSSSRKHFLAKYCVVA